MYSILRMKYLVNYKDSWFFFLTLFYTKMLLYSFNNY